jgi:hypothetical protein
MAAIKTSGGYTFETDCFPDKREIMISVSSPWGNDINPALSLAEAEALVASIERAIDQIHGHVV